MKPEDLNPEYNEMEVRITALLLGELSAEEAAEVQAAIAQDPELQQLHDRLKAVLGLVKEAVPTTELPADTTPEPLTLAHERREELLAVFKGGAPKAKEPKVIKVSFWRRYQKDLLKLAAMVVALMGVSWLMVGKREEEFYAGRPESKSRFSLLGFMDREMEAVSVTPPAPAAAAAVGADFSAAPSVPADPFYGNRGEITTMSTNAIVFYNRDAKAVTENRPQVRFSNRASGSAEPAIDWDRTARGVTTSSSKAKAAPTATADKGQVITGLTKEDAGGVRYLYSDNMAVVSLGAGVPLQTTIADDSLAPMGNVQTRHYSIALPQAEGAEAAQVKELSDLSRNDAIQVESRMGREFKGGQGSGGGTGVNNWGYQAELKYPEIPANESGIIVFSAGHMGEATPKFEVYDASPERGGVAGRSDSFGINGGARSQLGAFGSGEKAGMNALGTTTFKRETALADGSVDGERLYRESAASATPAPVPASPSTSMAAAGDKVDSWRKARQEYLPELRAKENARGEAMADGGAVAGDRLARGLERNGRIAGIALPTTPAQPARPNLDAVELNFTSPTGAAAKPGASTPGNIVGSGGVALGDVQKNVWYDNSGGVAGADPQWKGVLQNPTAGNQPQVGQVDGLVTIPLEGGGVKVGKTLTYATDAPVAGKPGSGVAENAFVTGGLRSKIGIGGQQSTLPFINGTIPDTTATDFGTRAKAVQMGKDFDADYVVEGEKLVKQQVDRFGASVSDGRKLSESAPVVAVDLTPRVRMSLIEDVALPTPEEAAKRQATETLLGEVSARAEVLKREGKLAEAKIMENESIRLGQRLAGSTTGLPSAAKGSKEEATKLVQDAKLLRELRREDEAEAKLKEALKQDPANSAAHYYLNLQQEAKYGDIARKRDYEQRARIVDVEKAWEIPVTRETLAAANVDARTNGAQVASGKVEGWRPAREEYLSQLRARDQVGEPLDQAQKEIDRLSDRRITLEREATYARAKMDAAAKQPQMADPDQGLAAKKHKESDVWKAQVRVAETEIAQVDAQLETKLGELRKLAAGEGSKMLAAGEPVEVFVVEDESLNSVYKIQEDGYVVLPKIGRVQVAGKDLPDAEKAIKEALEASPLARATVMVERADQMAMAKAEAKKAKEVDAEKKPEPAPPGIPQPEVSTAENAFSTFSLNVSDVSFKLAAASLEKGLMPEVGSVRTEEFINAFNYHDPEPTSGSRIAFAWERARYPFAHDRDLVRFSVQTAAVGREPGKPLNIVLLLDNSGSMERADRLRIRQECLRVLASQLQPQDKVSVVSFARTARLWVDGLTGAQVKELPERVGNLTPEGGTNLEAAMDLAYQTVQKHFAPQGVNRVVLLTDGAANLGEVQPESLKKKVVAYRQQGVALDCFGIGWEGYNDDLLEALSRNGDGRYGFVNSPEAATTEFAAQLSGALKVAASDVKVQVEWNPKRVTVFRQLGYAKHQLKKEEFRDNTVDAAEIGAAEAGNALYTVQVNAAGEGPLGVVRVRYRLPGTDDYREQEWPLAYDGAAKDMQQASVPLRLAGTASAFSEWLVSSPYAGEVTPERLIAQMAGVPEAYPADPRPKQLEWMIRQAKSLSGR